jgi:glycogen(starch) synthase
LPVTILVAGLDRKVVYDSHELWPDMMLVPESVKAIARAVERLLIKQTDLVMTVNEFIAEELALRYSLKRPPQVVYNCPKADLPITRRRERTGPKIALYQGQFTPDRGLDILVKATDYLLPDVRVVLRGLGIIERELKALSVGRRNVQFEDPVKMGKLVSVASEADVGIIPYLPTNLNNYLASPNKLFEYIQAGLPVAASNTPFMRKVILDNDIGVLFDSQDPRSIANALNSVTREDVLRRQRANLLPAAKKYNWENESKKLLNAYESLLSPSKRH